jgi:uncharacterized protein (TIGR02246 family)
VIAMTSVKTAVLGGLVIGLASCATTSEGTAPTGPRTVEAGAARTAITKILTDQYAAMEKGDPEAWAQAFAPESVFFGVGPNDAWSSRPGPVQSIQKEMEARTKAGSKCTTKSAGPHIGLTADGRAAWLSDEVEITVTTGDKIEITPLRLTEVLAEQDGNWWVHAVHWSRGVPNAQALEMAASGTLGKLKELGDSVAPGAQAVAAEFQKTSAQVNQFLLSLSARPDAFVFGTAPDEQIEGGDKIKDVFSKQIADLGLTITRRGGLRAGVAPNGRLGWVAANIDLTALSDGKKVKVPTRALMVYLNDGGLWRMVQAHFSNGITPEN